MIYIQRVRSNDVGTDYGKQVELGKVFMSHHNWDTGEIPVTITFSALSEEQSHLDGTKIRTTFKVRGDERGGNRIGVDCKEYANQDRICVLKRFMTEKLHLVPGQDFFILEDVGTDGHSFKLYGIHGNNIPATIILDKFKGQVVDMEEPDKTETRKIDEPLQVIYYGAPGTGKSFTIDDTTDDRNSVRTTFHPDSDYASFVGAYKPTMAPVPINAFVGTTVHHAKNAKAEDAYEQKIVYKYVPQAFLKAYVAAWSNLDKPFYLIIEEINRGNCAQIFGDLFQLLDRNNMGCSSYTIHADEDISQFLKNDDKGFASLSEEQKAAISAFKLIKDNGKTQDVGQDILDGKLLLLPPNLYIWATMNTSDQSLFPIDSAFKRRWNWKYMPIEYDPIDKYTNQPIDWKFRIGENLYSWGEFLSKINPEIYALTESSDKQMGYFFAKADPATEEISEDVFLNKVLFYLWTDVFKDYAMDSNVFRNEELNRPFRFTDFFENKAHIVMFLKNLGLAPIDTDAESSEDESTENDSDSSGRDYTKYSINGVGRYNKKYLAAELVRRFIAEHPEMSAFDVVKEWKTLGDIVSHFIELQEEFDLRKDKSPRVEKVECNGETIYVSTNGWGGINKMQELKQAVENKDWGLTISEYSE